MRYVPVHRFFCRIRTSAHKKDVGLNAHVVFALWLWGWWGGCGLLSGRGAFGMWGTCIVWCVCVHALQLCVRAFMRPPFQGGLWGNWALGVMTLWCPLPQQCRTPCCLTVQQGQGGRLHAYDNSRAVNFCVWCPMLQHTCADLDSRRKVMHATAPCLVHIDRSAVVLCGLHSPRPWSSIALHRCNTV